MILHLTVNPNISRPIFSRGHTTHNTVVLCSAAVGCVYVCGVIDDLSVKPEAQHEEVCQGGPGKSSRHSQSPHDQDLYGETIECLFCVSIHKKKKKNVPVCPWPLFSQF